MKNLEHKSPFKREIDRADKQLQRTSKIFEKVNLLYESGNIEGAFECAFDFSSAAENLTWTAREMPAYTGNPQARKRIEQGLIDHFPVRLGYTPEGWFGVIIPALLPKKRHGSPVIFGDSLFFAMRKFFWDKLQQKRYKDCTIIYRHVYHRDRPERQYRDHDNIEIKATLDTIAFYVMYDDSPLKCRHYYTTAVGDENRTEIFVVPQNEFRDWLDYADIHTNEEVILYENLP